MASGMRPTGSLRLLLLLLCLMLATWPAQASLPPVSCDGKGCIVKNSWGDWADRTPCKAAKAVFPTTEEELVAAVAEAVRTNTKLRVVSKFSHSAPKLVCPRGDSGIILSTRDYNRTIDIDVEKRTVTADAGVVIQDLFNALADKGLALPHSTYWSSLSVAGVISTGAHGSSLWGKGSAIHEHVTGIRIVVAASAAEGYATVKTFTSATPRQLAAAKVSLGLLGVISQVTFEVEPLFKRSVTYDVTTDQDLEAKILSLHKEQEFTDFTWYPAQRQVRYRFDNRVPTTTPGDGMADSFAPRTAATLELLRSTELALEGSRNSPGKCSFSLQTIQGSVSTGYGLVNNRSDPNFQFTGYPVVGFQNRIQSSSRCASGPADLNNLTDPANLLCVFDLGPKGLFGADSGIDVPVSKIPSFIRDIKKLVALRPLGLCTVEFYAGITLRYIKGNSSAYLGKHEDSMEVDFTVIRANDARTPRLDGDVHDELEQIAAFKYGGVPHFGKCRPAAFRGVTAKLPHLQEFLKVKQELDPKGIFSNEWTDALLGIRGTVAQKKPYCALEGLCTCSEDIHCNPEAGYFCRPGLVYKKARVCRFEGRMV